MKENKIREYKDFWLELGEILSVEQSLKLNSMIEDEKTQAVLEYIGKKPRQRSKPLSMYKKNED